MTYLVILKVEARRSCDHVRGKEETLGVSATTRLLFLEIGIWIRSIYLATPSSLE